METKIETKVCNDQGCKHKGEPQPVENFGIRKTTKDGLNPKCKVCVTTAQKGYYRARLEANGGKESKITRNHSVVRWDTSDHPDEDFLRLMRPMYSYMINTPILPDGTLKLGKTLGELVMFFDVPQRATMEAILHYLEKTDTGGYTWKIKPKGFDEFATKVKEMLPNGKLHKQPHNSVIYEQMELFSDRMAHLERKIDLLIVSLIGESDS